MLATDLALADTGIAGPGGSTPTKPLGLFYVGLATGSGITVRECVFAGGRAQNRVRAAMEALEMLRQYLQALTR